MVFFIIIVVGSANSLSRNLSAAEIGLALCLLWGLSEREMGKDLAQILAFFFSFYIRSYLYFSSLLCISEKYEIIVRFFVFVRKRIR